VLEDLGFVTCECAEADELGMILATNSDLVVLGLSVDGIEAGKILRTCARETSAAKCRHRAP